MGLSKMTGLATPDCTGCNVDMRLLMALTIALTGRVAFAGSETANPGFLFGGDAENAIEPSPSVVEEVKPPPQQQQQQAAAEAKDIYAQNSIVRRWQWTNVGAQALPDDECYNYFNLLGKQKVSPRDSASYVKALQSVYNGGRIVLHHTGSDFDTPESTLANHQKQKWGDMGYHFYIKKDCSILEGRPLHMMGTHAGHMPLRVGQCERNGQSGYDITNDFDFKAIGIVMEGNSDNSNLTAACGDKLKALIGSLHTTFGIDKIGGHGHYKADGTATECPGDHMKSWMRKHLGPESGMKFEGASDTDPHSLVNLINAANGGPVMTSTMQHEFEAGIGFDKTQNRPAIPPNTVPVNDLNGRAIMCSHCE